jgi:hypothetical protein
VAVGGAGRAVHIELVDALAARVGGRSGAAAAAGASISLGAGQPTPLEAHSGHTQVVAIDVWWPRLPPATRDWLIANNGDAVPDAIVEQIGAAGGPAAADPWWTRDEESTGRYLPDAATDWIEETANDETPNAP